MKILIVTLLFISAAQAIRNLVGLPEKRNTRLHQLLKDGPIDATKLTDPSSSKTTAHLAGLLRKSSLNDHGESGSGGSGSGPDEGGPEPVMILAEALRHIGPALKKLKEDRDEQSEGNAHEFLEAVKDNRSDDELKSLLGRHVVEQHGACQHIKKSFAYYMNKSGILSELLPGEDSINFEQDLAQVLEYAKMSDEFDIFEAFTHLAYQHRLHDHPGIKAIMTIGGMITDAACDEKLDGLFKKIGELVERHEPHGEFDVESRINLAVYREDSQVCKHGSPLKRRGLQSSIRDRLLDLLTDPDCNEINFMRYIINTVMEGIRLSHRFGHIHALAKGYEHYVISHVKNLMHHGQVDEAFKVVGDYVLTNLRGALTVGLVVKERLEPKSPEAPEPTNKGPEPTTEGSEPTTEGSEPTTAGSEPTTAGSEPTTEGSEPTTAGSEQTTAGSEPTTAGSEPTTERSEPTTEGSEQTTAGSQQTTAGPESTTAGPADA